MFKPKPSPLEQAAYHRLRAEQEFKRAELADDPIVMSLHTELANRYLALSESGKIG